MNASFFSSISKPIALLWLAALAAWPLMPAKAAGIDHVPGWLYTINGDQYTKLHGSLYANQGFVTDNTESGPLSRYDVDPATWAAINGKPITLLSIWIGLEPYASKFQRSAQTYNFDGSQVVIISLKSGSGGSGSSPNTKPAISAVAEEWDAEVGQELKIPLSVSDQEQDDFIMTAKLPAGSSFSPEYTAGNGLPTVDFVWIPTADQANKAYKLAFVAKETGENRKLKSLPMKVKIRVWPAGDRDQAYVGKLTVSTSKWSEDKLTLKGKIAFNKLMSAEEKTAFAARNDLTMKITQGSTGTGAVIAAAQPVTVNAKGQWLLTDIPLSGVFSCNLTIEFEGKMATRKIAGAPANCTP